MSCRSGNRLIVALDVPTRAAADALVEKLDGEVSWYKVGLELFMAEGPGMVRDYVAKGRRIMLDLKLHDIPATVGRATERAVDLGVELLTIHAGGGRPMMEASARVARDSGGEEKRLRVLAVTILTSMDDMELATLGIPGGCGSAVLRRSQLAMESGCDGVVASPLEVERLREGAPEDFLVVTPGVRPAGQDAGDQKRVATPRAARAAGADMVVVGRPIRDAEDPRAQAAAIAQELQGP